MSTTLTLANTPKKTTLPMYDKERTEFSFYRSVCDCKECRIPCKHMPGFLIPADILRIYEATKNDGEHLFDWAERSLLASPGAVIGEVATGRVYRLPTLVPARKPGTTECIFLKAGKCSIHAAAPYGCAFADMHMSAEEGNAVAKAGLIAIADAHQSTNHYTLILAALKAVNLTAPGPEEGRKQIEKALK